MKLKVLMVLAVAALLLAAVGAGSPRTVRILIYKDPGFQQDWASSGSEGDYKTILVTNPNSQDLTDFQVKLVFDPSSDSFFDSCQGGSLLGIWTGNGGQQVPFWVENWSATQAILWFKAPVLVAGGTTRFRLYCSEEAAGQHDGSRVFLMFDDFEDGTWEDSFVNLRPPTLGPSVVEGKGPYGYNEKLFKVSGDNYSPVIAFKSLVSVPESFILELYRRPERYVCDRIGQYVNSSDQKGFVCKLQGSYWSDIYYQRAGQNWVTVARSGCEGCCQDWWNWRRLRLYVNGTHCRFELTGKDQVEGHVPQDLVGSGQLFFGGRTDWGWPHIFYAFIFARKYVQQDPEVTLQ